MGNVFSFGWEISLMEWLQSFESGFTTALATFFTLFGEEYLLIFVVGFTYWCYNKDLGREIALTVMGGSIFGSMGKSVAMRRRPYMDNPTIKCIRASDPKADIMQIAAQGYSFPSLHALMSSALCSNLSVWFKKRAVTVVCIVFAFFIGLSRNYLGVHYPTDVLTGWLVGVGLMFLLRFIKRKLGYKAAFGIVIAVSTVGVFFSRDNEFYTIYGTLIGLLLGFSFEEKHVQFEMPRHWLSYILRPALGVLLFVGISSLLKIPLKAIMLPAEHIVTLLLRSLRYAISLFVIIGIYPYCFRLGKSIKETNC